MNEKKNVKTGMSRCLELAASRKPLVYLSAVLSSAASICSFIPYYMVFKVIQEILTIYPDMENINTTLIKCYAQGALWGIAANLILYFLAILCSHIAAFGTIYDLKIIFAKHLSQLPLGFITTMGSGKLRKIMEDNIDSIEGFLAHQFPDIVASFTAPVIMVIVLIAVDWRFGLASLAGIILAFVVQFMGYGSGNMKKNMEKYQTALEDMNNASVEFIRGMPVIKTFGRENDSFAGFKEAVERYTEWVLKFSLGWQNYMPAFTTIVNNIYLILLPVGILIGKHAPDFKTFAINFVFYLLFVPSVAGILNKIMYISESFMEINSNVARMDEVLSVDVLPDNGNEENEGNDISFENVSFYYDKESEPALDSVSFKAKEGTMTAVVGASGSGKSTIANLISRFWDI